MSGTLYIVGTPIGNLGDLSPRAAKALAAADVVLAEDTRVTSKLLAHLDLHKPLERCDENVIAARAPELLQRLEAGETLAFCSDAGMPCISDPGTVLVDAVRSAADADVRVEVIPGPTAVATALAASGLASDAFFFGGFLPRKTAERERLLTQLAGLPATLVFYESPHRTLASIDAMAKVFPQRRVCLARELTKLHEEELIGTPSQVAAALRARDGELKGEVVLLVEAPGGRGLSQGDELSPEQMEQRVVEVLESCRGSRSAVARELAKALGVPKALMYDALATGAGSGGASLQDQADGTPPRAVVRAIMAAVQNNGQLESHDDGDIR